MSIDHIMPLKTALRHRSPLAMLAVVAAWFAPIDAMAANHAMRCQGVFYAEVDHTRLCGKLGIESYAYGGPVKLILRFAPDEASTMPTVALAIGRIEGGSDTEFAMAVESMSVEADGRTQSSAAAGLCRAAGLGGREPTIACEAVGDATVGAIRFALTLADLVARNKRPRTAMRESLAFARELREARAALMSAPLGRIGAPPQVASTPVTTLFGIPVGVRLPEPELVACTDEAAAAQQKLCRHDNATREAAALARLGVPRQALADSGLRLQEVKLNDQLTDTALLFATPGRSLPFDMVTDRSDAVQFVSLTTSANAHEGVLQMLSRKYGKPTRTDATDSKDPQTGEVLRSTTNHFWDFTNVKIEYFSEAPSELGNVDPKIGRINVYTPAYAETRARMGRPSTAPMLSKP